MLTKKRGALRRSTVFSSALVFDAAAEMEPVVFIGGVWCGQEVTGGRQGGVYGISNDNNRQLKRICDRLQKATQHTLVEAELKQDLGFK